MIDLNLEEQIAQSVRSKIEDFLANVKLEEIIAEHLHKQISNVVINLTGKVFNQITEKRDFASEVSDIVLNLVNDQLVNFGKSKLDTILTNQDYNKLILHTVQKEVHSVAGSYNFPESSIPFNSINLEGVNISANLIGEGIIKNFKSIGIDDQSSQIQLTITDDGIVTTNNISSQNLLVEDNIFTNNLNVDGEFTVTGKVGHSPALNTYITNIASGIVSYEIEENNKKPIDISNKNIVHDNKLILNQDTLGPQIINSNLRKVGNLNELIVSGQALICETLVVTDKKVGVNTESPSGALSVWDEDAEFTLVKHAPKTMFGGTTRVIDFVLGTNNKEQIKLKSDGTIELNGQIRFNGLLINIVDRIPERVGEPGEIAIMHDGSAIYKCQSQNIWGKI